MACARVEGTDEKQNVLSDNKQDAVTLDTPDNIKFSDYRLTWDKVENATGYSVVINGDRYETKDNVFDLFYILKEDTYFASVQAIGDDEVFLDSDFADLRFELKATKGLKYTLLSDGSGYEISKGVANMVGRIYIPDNYNDMPVLKIAQYAFYSEVLGVVPDPSTGVGCNIKITAFRLPTGLKEIGEYSFAACAAVESIVLPDSVETIGVAAFANCFALSLVNIPTKVQTIPSMCFYSCNISSFDIPMQVTGIGGSAFYECPIKNLVIPETLKCIGAEAFSDTLIEEITFPENLQFDILYGSAFVNTPWLNAYPDGYVVLGDILLIYKGDFEKGTVITDEDIPKNIKYVAGNAFSYHISATKIVNFNVIESVYFRDGLKFLGGFLFYSSVKVRFPSDLKEIPDFFWGNPIKNCTLNIPEGVEKIGSFTCDSSCKMILPVSVKSMTNICVETYYTGTEQQFLKSGVVDNFIGIIDNEDYKTRDGKLCKIYFYSETEPDKTDDGAAYNGDYWHYDKNGDPVIWTIG